MYLHQILHHPFVCCNLDSKVLEVVDVEDQGLYTTLPHQHHMLIGWVWVSQVFIICSSLWVWLGCAMLGQGSEGVKGFSTDCQELLKS